MLWPFGMFYGHGVFLMAIWYICWPFGIFFPVLVCCNKKNLATLLVTARRKMATSAQQKQKSDKKRLPKI
jgi:hypothetical protein